MKSGYGPIKVTKSGICVVCGKPYQETQYYRTEANAEIFRSSKPAHKKCRLRLFAMEVLQ